MRTALRSLTGLFMFAVIAPAAAEDSGPRLAALLPKPLEGYRMVGPILQSIPSGEERGPMAMGIYTDPKSGLSVQIRILGSVSAATRALVAKPAEQGARPVTIGALTGAISEDKGSGGITVVAGGRYTVLVIWPGGIPPADALKYAQSIDFEKLAGIR